MQRIEVLAKIKAARDAVAEYKRQRIIKAASAKDAGTESVEKVLDDQVRSEAKSLLEESWSLGPSGTPCPRCNGSGRV